MDEKKQVSLGDRLNEGSCCTAHDDHQALAAAFKALSNPARLSILCALAHRDECCCGDICSVLPLAQSTVSQHLKVLREAGFIELEVNGLRSHYRLVPERTDWLLAQSREFVRALENST